MAEKKINDTKYLALSTMLRAKESGMLSRDLMDRMLSVQTFDEAARLIVDSGYENLAGADATAIESELGRRRKVAFEEILKIIPQTEPVDIFRLRYDYHNIKTLVKGEGGEENLKLLSQSGRVAPEELKEAFTVGDYRFLPKSMTEAITKSRALLARTANPQFADFETDRIYFEELTSLAESSGNEFLQGYVRLLADNANLRTAVRTVRMGKDKDFMMLALCPGGNVMGERLADAAFSGGDAVPALFTATPLYKAAALGAEAMKGGELTKFELACDNGISDYVSGAKLKPFGVEAVVEYLTLLETEITSVRMILTGRLAGVNPAKIKERLRDLNA
ncbi:MAG: V-type ATPase subunit [Ruminococcaceae bacterium]|nr:V-type ATPase subunit [Oscillospiraceae bacterium]